MLVTDLIRCLMLQYAMSYIQISLNLARDLGTSKKNPSIDGSGCSNPYVSCENSSSSYISVVRIVLSDTMFTVNFSKRYCHPPLGSHYMRQTNI